MILVFAAAVGAAILFSALLTAAEAAVFAPSDSRIRALAEQGVRGSGALAQLRARPERVLLLLRFFDTFADVTAGALVAYATYVQLHGLGLAIALGILSLLVLYLGELLPLGLARTHAPGFALVLAPTLLVLTRALGPGLDIAARFARVEPRAREAGPGITERDIRHLTVIGHTEGAIEEHERALIERAFRMDETKAWDIMTPRVDIFAWKDDRLLRELVTELASVPYSRVPVYHDTIDNITGVLYVRDAYQALVGGQRDVPIRSLAREPLVVAGSMPLDKLLRDFQTRRIHLAIVVDEYGGTDGLVTLEDVLEELVGEIVDETDIAEDPIMRVSRVEIVASGDVDLREINHYLNASFPQLEHRSLNGYLLEELGRVPEPGERLEREGIQIEIVEATDTLVERVRLRRIASSADGAAPSAASGAEPRSGAMGGLQQTIDGP
ncbi:MAG: hemolysin family protein [Gemmatimonadetes bacterium]|nr:hemolysin family protein [Gemmatimonadota bacterium]